MSADTPERVNITEWEAEVRQREEDLRIAFLAADIPALDAIIADGYLVNSPLQQVLDKPKLLALLAAGRIRHSEFDVVIECIGRHGDVAVVMGRDSVIDPPAGTRTQRRFTNLWQYQAGVWRTIARHAHVLAAGTSA